MDKIEEICRDFELMKFDISIFQGLLGSEMGTSFFEDEFNKLKTDIMEKALTSLDLIQFTELEEKHYTLGVEVARQLVAEMKEFERTHKVRRYVDDNVK